VNTSDTEGFPNSYLQAWIRGTPLVAFFDPDGVIVREGLGAAPRSLDEMVSAVDSLLTDRERWQATSARARGYMAREFDEATILQPYLSAFALGNGDH
jgi:glycosyltransferase involved in cell wall biosynthesis